MGVAHVKSPNSWVSLYLHVVGFVESMFLMWSLQEEGSQEVSPMLNDEPVYDPSQLVD